MKTIRIATLVLALSAAPLAGQVEGAGWDEPALVERDRPCDIECVPVPEPSTWLLMATGMFALGYVAWRRGQEAA